MSLGAPIELCSLEVKLRTLVLHKKAPEFGFYSIDASNLLVLVCDVKANRGRINQLCLPLRWEAGLAWERVLPNSSSEIALIEDKAAIDHKVLAGYGSAPRTGEEEHGVGKFFWCGHGTQGCILCDIIKHCLRRSRAGIGDFE